MLQIIMNWVKREKMTSKTVIMNDFNHVFTFFYCKHSLFPEIELYLFNYQNHGDPSPSVNIRRCAILEYWGHWPRGFYLVEFENGPTEIKNTQSYSNAEGYNIRSWKIKQDAFTNKKEIHPSVDISKIEEHELPLFNSHRVSMIFFLNAISGCCKDLS